MSTLSDTFLSPNYTDGEGIYIEDIQQGERGILARMLDQIVERSLPAIVGHTLADGPDVDYPSTQHGGIDAPSNTIAIALTVSGGMPIQGSANNKIKIAAGTLLQKVNTADGGDMSLVPFTFDGTQEQTIANGDASHPRIDLLEMKLVLIAGDSASRDVEDAVTDAPSSQTINTSWRVQCTLQIKQGTPGATPAWPAVDSGFVAIAALYVGTNYVGTNPLKFDDTAGANVSVWDLRMPVNVQTYRVGPQDFQFDTTKWTLDGTRHKVTAAASATALEVLCPVTKGRIIAVEMCYSAGSGAVVAELGQGSGSGALGGTTNMAIMRGSFGQSVGLKQQQNTFRYWDNPSALGGIPIGNNYGPSNIPVWANGRRSAREIYNIGTGDGVNADPTIVDPFAVFSIFGAPTSMIVYSVTFHVAVGL